jgi:hypothetical protein
MTNCAVGKVGKSILFDSKRWGATGGDNEAPIFYENLFHRNPDVNFYILGGSDFSRLDPKVRARINRHGNVYDAWDGITEFKNYFKQLDDVDQESINIKYLEHWRKNVDPGMDCGFFFMGPTATSNVRGKMYKMTDPTTLASPLFMQAKYAGPLIDYLNETRIPYGIIVNDPRYWPAQMRDLMHRPVKVLSQYDEVVNHRSIREYGSAEIEHVKVPCEYSRVETIFLIGKTRGEQIVETPSTLDAFFGEDTESTHEKNIDFMVVCNEGLPSRYPQLKKYILDHVENVEIYGKWDERTIGDDPRFKGPKKFNDLQEMLPRVKYTFCIPIKKGWVTAKFWEMAHYGIIPFLHPDYDEQNHLKCPEFLRVTDSKDLFDKIEFLENNPDAYSELRRNIDGMLKDEYYDGSYLNELAMKTIKELTTHG